LDTEKNFSDTKNYSSTIAELSSVTEENFSDTKNFSLTIAENFLRIKNFCGIIENQYFSCIYA